MLWRLIVSVILASLVWTMPSPVGHTQISPFRLEGYVKDASSQPISGVTVSLAHPTAGRSRPRITDSDGYYLFNDIRAMPDSYYLEVYWGRTLMYRESVMIDRNIEWPHIILNY